MNHLGQAGPSLDDGLDTPIGTLAGRPEMRARVPSAPSRLCMLRSDHELGRSAIGEIGVTDLLADLWFKGLRGHM